MRRTLTIDDDVAARLVAVRATTGETLAALVNRALRVGLHAIDREPAQRRDRYSTPVSSGGKVLHSVTSTSEAIAFIEGEDVGETRGSEGQH